MPRLWLTIILISLTPQVYAAQGVQAFDRARRQEGLWLGVGLTHAQLNLNTPSAKITTQITALPTTEVGAEWWPREHTGLFAQARIGTGAQLEIPALGAGVHFNAHQFELEARYRWFQGPRGTALAPFLGLGLQGTVQTVQLQRPSLLTNSLVMGPSLRVGLRWPILAEQLWIRAGLLAALPFFVREWPDDSGDPVHFLRFGGRLTAVYKLTQTWAIQLELDLYDQALHFEGEGTRAATVFDAATQERWATALVLLRYQR